MRKIILAATLAVGLSGCATIQTLQSIVSTAEAATISPSQIYIAVNAFDTLQIGVKSYFDYCRANLAQALCSVDNRRIVSKAVRAGRAARDQLETYLDSSAPVPSQVFNTLRAAVSALQNSAIKGVTP